MKGSKYTFSIARRIFRLSSFTPYDPKLSTYMDEQFLFYKISDLQKRKERYCTAYIASGNPCTGILPRYQNHFDCAGQKDRSSGNENKNRHYGISFNSFMKFPCEISHYVSGF